MENSISKEGAFYEKKGPLKNFEKEDKFKNRVFLNKICEPKHEIRRGISLLVRKLSLKTLKMISRKLLSV